MGDGLDSRFKKGLLDFHTHSTHSDGTYTPSELVKHAKQQGISALALTDHNVISGLPEFNQACKEQGILAIPFGTEIYAEIPEHVLLPSDNDAPDLIMLGKNSNEKLIYEYHALLQKDRHDRWIPESMDKVRKLGFYISDFDLFEQSKDLGVPEIIHGFIFEKDNIQRLVDYMREVDPDAQEEEIRANPNKFVNRHIYSPGKPAYVKRLKGFGLSNALSLAEAMNCRLFIAHPGGTFGSHSDGLLDYFIRIGVHGIEVRNYFNNPEQNTKFDNLASEHGLIRSGGSDCHGTNGPFKIGCYDKPENQLPKEILDKLWDNLPS